MPTNDETTVYVIDSDAIVVATLKELFSSVHIEAEYFNSADECLARVNRYSRGCMIADAAAPDVCVATFQHRLHEKSIELSVLFLSYSGDVATAIMALKCGAADFLEKPFNGQALLDAVHRAIEINQIEAHYRATKRELRTRFDALTPREWEVVLPMIKGCSSRMIAEELGVSEKTVEVYRSRIMRKTGAANLPELIRIAIRIDLLGGLAQCSLDLGWTPPVRRQSQTALLTGDGRHRFDGNPRLPADNTHWRVRSPTVQWSYLDGVHGPIRCDYHRPERTAPAGPRPG